MSDQKPVSSARFRKQHLAVALALLAVLSYAYSIGLDQSGKTMQARQIGIMTALAADDASGYEIFLKLDAIQGDSDDSKHRNEIVVDSYAWTEVRAVGAPKVSMNGFTITMPVSRASAKMFLFGASGTKIARVVLSVRKDNGLDFLKWTLTDGQITSYQTVGNTHGDGVSDQITITFGKIEVEYRQVLPDGTLGPAQNAGWDQRTGKSV